MSDARHSQATAAPASAGFIRRYVFSTDHHVIGCQYFFLALFSVLLGILLSLVMRFHIVWPSAKLPWFGVMKPETYLALMTIHGTVMVFFVLTTAPQSAFGNIILPRQIGAPEMAFPLLNMLSFWFTFAALLVLLASFFVVGGAPSAGWTAYPPLSAIASAAPGEAMGQTLWLLSIVLFCAAALMGSINFIVTVLDLRARGMTLLRLPLTAWAWFVTAVIALLAFAVLAAAGILLLLDRSAGTSFFIPGGLIVSDRVINHKGGSPLLWQHLFWFFGHPEVYIAILPGMGVTSHILSNFARKPVFGYRAMAYAMMAIALLGFLVWGHHMFISGMSPYSSIAFSVLTMAVGVPSAIKTFNWLATLWNGSLRFPSPMLFALGFVSVFVSGGLTGLFLGQPAVDIYFHDTYFVVAHFHMIMGVAAVFGIFAATYYWFPAMFGRLMSERLGKAHFWLTFIGVYAIFMPMHFLGMAGHPRRYAETTGVSYLAALDPLHRFITIAAFATAAAQAIFLFNLFWSMWRGGRAPANPWQATTLEWAGAGELVAYRAPYEYSVPGAAADFVMQNDPGDAGEKQ